MSSFSKRIPVNKVATIDLTTCDDTEYEESLSVAAETQQDEDENVVDDDDDAALGQHNMIPLGFISTTIVGIQYYKGTAHPGEYVDLVREPRNPYDCNAIRVDNMAGVKVGHIRKGLAQILAPVLDNGEYHNVTVDATIPTKGRISSYSLPLRLDFFGTSLENQQTMKEILGRNFSVHQEVSTLDQIIDQNSEYQMKVITKEMDWERQQQHLDDMFEKISKSQLENLPDISAPTLLTTQLMKHQLEGVRWLYQRETEDQPVPLYKQIQENGKTVWLSEITRSSQVHPPNPIKGSILADGQ